MTSNMDDGNMTSNMDDDKVKEPVTLLNVDFKPDRDAWKKVRDAVANPPVAWYHELMNQNR